MQTPRAGSVYRRPTFPHALPYLGSLGARSAADSLRFSTLSLLGADTPRWCKDVRMSLWRTLSCWSSVLWGMSRAPDCGIFPSYLLTALCFALVMFLVSLRADTTMVFFDMFPLRQWNCEFRVDMSSLLCAPKPILN